MTAHARADVGQYPEGCGKYTGHCTCGWKTEPMANAGAAGFTLSAHVKKANGLPVFGTKAHQVVEQLTGASEFYGIVEREFPGYTLPATLVKVPSNQYRVANYRSLRMRGADWDPFTADVQRNEGGNRWVTIGTVEDEGRGGAWDVEIRGARIYEVYGSIPMIDATTKQEVTGYDRYMDRQNDDAIRFIDWCLAMPGQQPPVFDGDTPSDWTPHAVIGLLVDEASAVKRLNGKRTRTCILEKEMAQAPVAQWGELSGGSRDPKDAAQWLIRNRKADARIWTDGAWRTVQEVLG